MGKAPWCCLNLSKCYGRFTSVLCITFYPATLVSVDYPTFLSDGMHRDVYSYFLFMSAVTTPFSLEASYFSLICLWVQPGGF